jgi:hypothetical protein
MAAFVSMDDTINDILLLPPKMSHQGVMHGVDTLSGIGRMPIFQRIRRVHG